MRTLSLLTSDFVQGAGMYSPRAEAQCQDPREHLLRVKGFGFARPDRKKLGLFGVWEKGLR